jgi:hypothetical protein
MIYFNEQCLKKRLTPSYAKIKIPNVSQAHKYTQLKITNIRIKDEVKYLHSKKQRLNQQLYQLHLYLAHTWNHTWPYIQRTIEEKLQRGTRNKYKSEQKTRKPLPNANTDTTWKMSFLP